MRIVRSTSRATPGAVAVLALIAVCFGCSKEVIQGTDPPPTLGAACSEYLKLSFNGRLTMDSNPDWSWANPEMIVYQHTAVHPDEQGFGYQIWLKNLATGDTRFLVNGWDPCWSGDGRRIAYIGLNQLKVLDIEDGTVTQLTSGSSGAAQPNWSRTGNTLLYHGSSGAWLRDMDSGEVTFLRRPAGSPVLSPSGFQVAVFPGLAVFDIRSPQKLFQVIDRLRIVPLSWTPNGEAIAYFEMVSFADTSSVRLVDLTTGADVRLIPDSKEVSFSPDGKRMVFSRHIPETRKTVLFVADLDLSNCEQITSLEDYLP